MALHASNLTTANPQRGLKVKDELEFWTVEHDGLINEYQCKEYEWVGLRSKSPPFRPETFIPGTDSKTVIDIMTKGFLTVPNAEARLVVKVFIPKHLVSLDSMKAIASMLCLVDPLLSDIHPAHCGPSSLYSLGLQYNSLARDDANDLQAEMLSAVEVEDPWNNRLSPDRKPLELLPRPGDLGETKYRHRIHRILGATSVQDLIHLMDIAIYGEEGRYPHASPAYCFLENKTTIAIEFNQHCGTLDMLETSLWAIFCVKLTQHCLDKSGTFFHESYPNLRYCSTICDFLEEQGLEGKVYKSTELSRAEQFSNRVSLMKEIISSQGPLTLVWDEYFDQKFWESKLLSHGMVPVDDIDPRYQTWNIGTDVSLRRMSEWAGYKQLNGLEIIGSVLRDTPECWEEVLDMVSILRNNFRLTVGKSCGFHIHVSKGTGPILLHLKEVKIRTESSIITGTYIYRQWSERNVPADFEQYIPVDKAVDRRTLGIMKKLWTAETLQRLKLLITPSMGSKSCLGLSKCHSFDEFDEGSEDKCRGTVEFRYLEGTLDPELILRWSQLMVSLFQFADLASPQAWQNFVPAILQCPVLGKMDPNVLRVFLVSLGKGDDHGFWINRIEIMSNLPLDAQQLARRPADDNEILPPLDNGYIDALRDELCTREMKLPCTIQKAATLNESESSTDPDDLAKLLSEKAGFFL
ncbi:hypothetical protein FocTR4_00005209 [Fusarium oxysporum f. sp. cubense]|uniref:Amidoligase enzyme n=1 Tax=Fusarium oxysporum f. sp. cubense TaxID=61366 RepID=A0A5C6TJK4_FUSOC|nr:hypothetical protein FocTR4_00005209 [Fusarium oxysporum f. sp. cubense]